MISPSLPTRAALALFAGGLLAGGAVADPPPPVASGRTQDLRTPQPAFCGEPFGDIVGMHRLAPAELRRLAGHCADAGVSRLYYNRAYHAELLADLRLLSQLQKGYAGTDRTRLEQGRMYIGLVERFAARAWHQRPQVIDELNQAYEQSIRTVELTIGGYDRLAAGSPVSP
jgi:hypothetical protein